MGRNVPRGAAAAAAAVRRGERQTRRNQSLCVLRFSEHPPPQDGAASKGKAHVIADKLRSRTGCLVYIQRQVRDAGDICADGEHWTKKPAQAAAESAAGGHTALLVGGVVPKARRPMGGHGAAAAAAANPERREARASGPTRTVLGADASDRSATARVGTL
ncbi:hypothetical protein GGTG_03866 [Gaeumannomyces tritici R3-111a-1]|uniref:Uncharacterized protein n=1 Tax=Gaeumannomyces tritici (strain R3-111a-1) TaxID=644352 RepID=J3NRG2_GAET3|nr:hypothetical protein GGTG_03866 [Gaeumannomyces tritici R3-111a-1]EJT78768.1 hypothetical protein GGTG_03866 [Gaeumannomyces tritici R3-111a-1]